ncbi:MAG: OpgC domain-containing protein [Pseudomonadota bacterium]
MSTATPSNPASAKRERDLRLDFFRGLAMFIILLAHTPMSLWRMWIPARFGFSDATEIFVFCSGMASGIAFGAVFMKKSWFLGAARIAFRVWQVYWAHIGVVIATACILVALQSTGMGEPGKDYTKWFPVGGFFSTTEGRPEATLLGLFTLTYVPGLFDILPMYLVILCMVPLVMVIYRAGGREAVFAFMAVTWLAANLAGYARHNGDEADLSAIQAGAVWLGDLFLWMNLPGVPWEQNATWFFNPFAWQLVFFTGFCFAMGWIPAPPVNRWLVIASIIVVVVTIPFAWYKLYQFKTGYMPDSVVGRWLWDTRSDIQPFRWKTWIGAWRYLHFLAIAYLAWAAVGPGGVRLRTGWDVRSRLPSTRRIIAAVLGTILFLLLPYNISAEVMYFSPDLHAGIFQIWPEIPRRYVGITHLVFMSAIIPFTWHTIGDRARRWLVQDAFLAVVPVIRKVGTQSLAVFLVSIAFSRVMGWWFDSMDAWLAESDWTYMTRRDVWIRLLVNFSGFGVLIGTAYFVSWFKRQPWRDRAEKRQGAAQTGASTGTRSVPAE